MVIIWYVLLWMQLLDMLHNRKSARYIHLGVTPTLFYMDAIFMFSKCLAFEDILPVKFLFKFKKKKNKTTGTIFQWAIN